MFERVAERSRQTERTLWSIAIHGALLFALIHSRHAVLVRASLPGTPQGAKIELSYLPGGAHGAAPRPSHKPAATPVRQAKLSAPLPPAPMPPPVPENTAPSPGETSSSSNDALGTEDIRIALTTFSPSPKPDLSRLPHGTQGDVVVDVTIDPTGQIADLQVLQTLGYGIDGAVADTVRTWKFSPATKDGVPVASVQELHFHYGPA
jgi:periplasmic protein TonB